MNLNPYFIQYKLFLFLLIADLTVFAQNPASLTNASGKGFYDVTQFGAKGNGTDNDTKSINEAITEASSAGGGTVYFPAGDYLSGSLHLQSNIALYIDQGATIIAAPVSEENGYDPAETGATNGYQDYGHSHWHNSLIWGDSIHDVSILGTGTIWGRGLYRDWVRKDQSANKSIALVRCRNVIIRDITIKHGGWFAILATGVDNFTLDNVKMDTNRDGVDVDCCKNVRISNCTVNSPYDDGICLKSSYALGTARPTENVTITNCQLSGYVEGSLLDGTFRRFDENKDQHPTGRIKFGTESNGGFRNITISNCVFDYCRGFALESVDGAILEDVSISNITMRDIVNDPIFIRLGARMRGPETIPVGQVHRIMISNIMVYHADPGYACTINGLKDHNIEDVTLNHIHIYYKGGGLAPDSAFNVPEQEKRYPEPGMFGTPPAYGFYIRHAARIKMNDVELHYLKKDTRAPFVLDDVNGIYLFRINAQMENGRPFAWLRNVKEFHLSQSENIRDRHESYVQEGAIR